MVTWELWVGVSPREGYGRDQSLSEAQSSVVWNGPVRSAVDFQCFRICSEGPFQMRFFQMLATVSSVSLTVSSEGFRASDTIRQPETGLPFAGTPTLIPS